MAEDSASSSMQCDLSQSPGQSRRLPNLPSRHMMLEVHGAVRFALRKWAPALASENTVKGKHNKIGVLAANSASNSALDTFVQFHAAIDSLAACLKRQGVDPTFFVGGLRGAGVGMRNRGTLGGRGNVVGVANPGLEQYSPRQRRSRRLSAGDVSGDWSAIHSFASLPLEDPRLPPYWYDMVVDVLSRLGHKVLDLDKEEYKAAGGGDGGLVTVVSNTPVLSITGFDWVSYDNFDRLLMLAPSRTETISNMRKTRRLSTSAAHIGMSMASAHCKSHETARKRLSPRTPGPNPPLASSSFGRALLKMAFNLVPDPISLVDLPEGPVVSIAKYLDAKSLCNLDLACSLTRTLNQSNAGAWRALGNYEFYGLELEGDGIFDLAEPPNPHDYRKSKFFSSGAWKSRLRRFRKELATFRPPFVMAEISRVFNADDVAYCRCMLRADLLLTTPARGVYIEFQVIKNPDNLSLALVDFETGGHSSVTFSPETGAVIRERKIREIPRKVEGAYVQVLSAIMPYERFEGSIALYLLQGHLAFLRRCTSNITHPMANKWETTGFVTDLSWAEGRSLTPCFAFRDAGRYHVKILSIGRTPPSTPLPLDVVPSSYDERRWENLNWEAEAVAV